MGVDGAAPEGPRGKKGTESNAGTANSHPHRTDGPGDTRTRERARCSLKAPPFPITTAPWSYQDGKCTPTLCTKTKIQSESELSEEE